MIRYVITRPSTIHHNNATHLSIINPHHALVDPTPSQRLYSTKSSTKWHNYQASTIWYCRTHDTGTYKYETPLHDSYRDA